MKTEDLQAEVTAIDQESAQLKSGVELDIVKKLLNLVERLIAENAEQKAELQNLRDEINRLKGEQGKPDIKANKKKGGDISSEDERRQAEADANGEVANAIDGKKKRRREPTPEKKAALENQFDGLFTTITGYEELDGRIAKTLAKKAGLLRVLEHPQLPLHNNASELGAKVQARVRDVSFQTRSEEGTKIKDTFLTHTKPLYKIGRELL